MKNYTYDKRLEGLRGLCALVVAYDHLVDFDFFGLKKVQIFAFFFHFQFAHIAVLIFFIISGYVMGVSHINTPFIKENIVQYLKKRLVRLYPIYLLALLITVIFGYRFISLEQIAGYAFFLQVFIVKVTHTNVALWSLSFEWVYYLLFIALWAVNKYSKRLYLVLMMLCIFVALISKSNNCIQALLIGWVFWLLGLFVSQNVTEGDGNKTYVKPFISYFFVLLAAYLLESGGFFMRLLHINFTNVLPLGFNDLVYLPVCILLITGVTNKRLKYSGWIKAIAYAIPAFNVLSLFYFHHDIWSNEDWLCGTVFFGLSIVFITFKVSNRYFEKLNFVGKISYAIYVFHFSIGFFLDLWLKQYLSGFPLIITGLICWLCLTFGLSYLAEIIIQPRIRNYFFKPRVA